MTEKNKIIENLKQLQELEARITMLRLMKEHPEMTQQAVAEHLSVTTRTIQRWWQRYRDDGLHEFMSLPDVTMEEHEASTPAFIDLSAFRTFANALPRKGSIQELSGGLCDVLQGLLKDVDHITVAPNRDCNLNDPEAYDPDMLAFHQQVGDDERRTSEDFPEPEEMVKRLVNQMVSTGFSVKDYHAPSSFIYYFDGGAFLGIILLWRKRTKRPISNAILAFMHSIEALMIYVLSDFVTRHAYENPLDAVYREVLEDLVVKAGLTKGEHRVLEQLLHSGGQKEAAQSLHLSLHTVKFHAKLIYRKTGTHSLEELFSKFFTPRLLRQKPPKPLKPPKKK